MRSRAIKPGFFKNEDLAACGPYGMLLFAGLWCIADREGRLEDRPPRIRGEIFAYAPRTNVVVLLDKLESFGFIHRYRANDCKYIQIVNWKKHQYPHVKEADSTIPAPDSHEFSTRRARLTPDSLTPDSSAAVVVPEAEIVSSPRKPPPPPKNGNGNHKTAEQRAAMVRDLELHEHVKEMLVRYPGAQVLVGKPDDVVIGKCVAIARRHPQVIEEDAIKAALMEMARGHRAPETSWMWFPVVIDAMLPAP